MNRIKIKKKFILNKKKKIIYIIVSFISCILLSFYYINKKITTVYLDIAENEVKKIANIIINDSIDNKLSNSIKSENLFYVKKNSKEDISSIDFNTIEVNKFLNKVTNNLEKNLKYIESGNIEKISNYKDLFNIYDKKNLQKGIVCKIPLGNVFSNPILGNLSGSIPVRLNLTGNIISNVNIKTKNYGINNTLVEIYMDINLTMEVILPYTKKKTNIKTSIPIGLKMIQGSVPSYYSSSSTPITVPIE